MLREKRATSENSGLNNKFSSPYSKTRKSLGLRNLQVKNYSESASRQPLTVKNVNLNSYKGIGNGHQIRFSELFKSPIEQSEWKGSACSFLGVKKRQNLFARPLHDPNQDLAIVLYDPTIERPSWAAQEPQEQEPKRKKTLADILGVVTRISKVEPVAVVVDPKLCRVLRPHQIEGVKFLYKSTTGRLDPENFGCIMADEMGLGKTLQCLALLWTLLKQSPYPSKPTIEKAIITCPSSLVHNWANEIEKWIGRGRLNAFVFDGKLSRAEAEQQIKTWCECHGKNITKPVMIASYETLRMYQPSFGNSEIGLMLCDEGHRLKNCESQTFIALKALNCKSRVILSGTPIQNDLMEYFSLLNFTNPNLLGTKSDFKKNFENTILTSRDADCTEKQRLLGEEKLDQLNSLVNKFIIRRSNDILTKYLPKKYEYIVFIKLTDFQTNLYKLFVKSAECNSMLQGEESSTLAAITLLKKLCNHPDLLNLPSAIEGSQNIMQELKNTRKRSTRIQDSSKFSLVDKMLQKMMCETDDKIVLISNYTKSLDLLEWYCREKRYSFLRLDGSMNIKKRQKYVEKFNDKNADERIFLLSSKAGGCGLNLVGANRLILFDPDWNPAADQQALARVWRDGQRKDCFVYRFISSGTIEEKIFQRQSHKQSLSSCVVDEVKDATRHFSSENLKALFKYNQITDSDTHESFNCKRCIDGHQKNASSAMLYGDFSTWNHYGKSTMHKVNDFLLQNNDLSYCFQYICK